MSTICSHLNIQNQYLKLHFMVPRIKKELDFVWTKYDPSIKDTEICLIH